MSQRLPRLARPAAALPILLVLAACTLVQREPAYYYGLKDVAPPSSVGAAKVEPPPPAVARTSMIAPKPPVAATEQCSESVDCMARLRRMVSDPDRSWIGRPESAASFVTGTRLFAYRALLPQLTCTEMQAAKLDIDGSMKQLESAPPGLATSQIEKTLLLADDVATEIAVERNKRC